MIRRSTKRSAGRRTWLPAGTFLLWLALSSGLMAEELVLTRSVLASGGTVKTWTVDAQWRVSGTLGQWEASPARALSNNDWVVTGGFWPLATAQSEPEPPPPTEDPIFSDRFQASAD